MIVGGSRSPSDGGGPLDGSCVRWWLARSAEVTDEWTEQPWRTERTPVRERRGLEPVGMGTGILGALRNTFPWRIPRGPARPTGRGRRPTVIRAVRNGWFG